MENLKELTNKSLLGNSSAAKFQFKIIPEPSSLANILREPNLKPGSNSPKIRASQSNTPTLVARRVPYANSIQLTEHVEQFDKKIAPKSTMADKHFNGHGNITALVKESPYTVENRTSSLDKEMKSSKSMGKFNNVNEFWNKVEKNKRSILER